MNADRTATIRRYALACAVALLFTIVLLFVMTQLIAPVDDDPVVNRMIRQLELRRDPPPDIRFAAPEFEPPPKPDLTEPDRTAANNAVRVPAPAESAGEETETPEANTEPTDWWSQARIVAKQVGEEDFEKWLLSQDRTRYVSIMQGPMPASGNTRPTQEEDRTIYRDVYGDKVIQISDNCTLRAQSIPGDYSGFVRNLPPLVTCYEQEIIDMSGLEDYLQGDTLPANR